MVLFPIALAVFWFASQPAIQQPNEPETFAGELTDPARDREVGYRVYVPAGADGELPVVLVSHGGAGSNHGEHTAEHLGTGLARAGYLVVHIGHRRSSGPRGQLTDRPADVSFVLDALGSGALAVPGVVPMLDRVGHVGHSYGAYTSHAVAGAAFEHGTYRDPRIAAIVPLSPQGPDQFGAFDRGREENTWAEVGVPVCSFIGQLELNTNVVGTIDAEGWRLMPFVRYPIHADKHVSVIPGADHSDLWRTGSKEIERFIIENSAAFFDVHLKGDRGRRGEIMALSPLPNAFIRSKIADVDNDGDADGADLELLRRKPSDVNGDGRADDGDVAALVEYLRETSGLAP